MYWGRVWQESDIAQFTSEIHICNPETTK